MGQWGLFLTVVQSVDFVLTKQDVIPDFVVVIPVMFVVL